MDGIENVLQEANIRWFIIDTHGILHARPRPRYGVFAPVFTPNGIAAFGRDLDSARQVWSKHEGYPGDVNYRDFYRDIGFDLDFDYVKSASARTPASAASPASNTIASPATRRRSRFTIAKPRCGWPPNTPGIFSTPACGQIQHLASIMDRPPHAWFRLTTRNCSAIGGMKGRSSWIISSARRFTTSRCSAWSRRTNISAAQPTQQIARPSASSWGSEGYWNVWLNETNEWIQPHLHIAQERMTELARQFPAATGLKLRALKQAGRELLLAQSSDWPFILRTGTSPDYARKRVKDHLLRFIALHEQLTTTCIDEPWLARIESLDNIFPDIDYRYWA